MKRRWKNCDCSSIDYGSVLVDQKFLFLFRFSCYSFVFYKFQFLNEIQTSSVTVCTLRAVTDLLELYIHFPKLTRSFTRVS
ncbi:unnamed protein product [Brugia timori]|uniref:Ovule protein n=1 Tax=Brugia timori TaxID=42155 RepID=A0A0R3QSM6_9BILA|nr:unnamed protein product [Brugia timori]